MQLPNEGTQLDRTRLRALRQREDEAFAERTPESAALVARAVSHMPGGVPMGWMRGLHRTPPIYVARGEGPRFTDVDGNDYIDFNVCDLAMTMGFGPPPIIEAVSRQMAEGAHFLLPTEATIDVVEKLARRNGLPQWQFTLSASGANTEVIRIARFMTGRQKIVVFQGHYHGHIDDTLVHNENGRAAPELLGLPADAGSSTIILPFNDLERLETTLRGGDIALVITEPALTNCNLVLPDEGFLDGVRRLTRAHGTLLCYDEAHTYQFAYGGLVRDWGLESDFHVLGKGIGTGISFALYGMTDEIGDLCARHLDSDVGAAGLATGGTTYASALAVSAAQAALTDVLTEENYRRTQALGQQFADGLKSIFEAHALDWRPFHLGPRVGFCMARDLPRTYVEAEASLDAEMIDARRVFMANRGIWDAVASAGPQASFAHDIVDIDTYLETADGFIAAIR